MRGCSTSACRNTSIISCASICFTAILYCTCVGSMRLLRVASICFSLPYCTYFTAILYCYTLLHLRGVCALRLSALLCLTAPLLCSVLCSTGPLYCHDACTDAWRNGAATWRCLLLSARALRGSTSSRSCRLSITCSGIPCIESAGG